MGKKEIFVLLFKKICRFAGLFMGFFATVLLAVLFMQDTRRNTYELLHTKPVSAGKYLSGKVVGGFVVCLIILAVLNLVFFGLCLVSAGNNGFEVHLADFLLATCFYILPNMLMIVSVYSLISLLFKSPLPTVPLLLLYMVYSMFFVIIFSLVRGVTYSDEIGITIGF
ncbi:ABC transporter permease [Petralouisia muris]